MTVIVNQYRACDGWNVNVVLSNGRKHTFHFSAGLPGDVQAAVRACEEALLALEEEEFEIEPET